ncbi:ATP-dependent 6-phosphofructokinase [Syntrophobacter fumaroxidans]|uniref:ATP-dependent 6-phosphofructokinase n=1 Tax=Syntrophobacter fumaroxidans (strain DSM 10017 / MPOB) TaxID=335543 RepID=A0LMI0_SYNFM|nr:ATP-dependent 6-phosphofructokinase [Syntrophobacter fumaroxidans]ABK18632.1 6-phosphofructokinase [Syntrophobacter fumaroxidans MPOB]
MNEAELNFEVARLGACRIPSPMGSIQFVEDDEHVLYHTSLKEIKACECAGREPPGFEIAGPRREIFFDPSKLKCGIVTCGGLCPGLNDVIRSIVLSLHHHYGVQTVFGFPYGFEGLTYRYGHRPLELSPETVRDIHMKGGTILGSSRGPQDVLEMVDTLDRMNIGILFTIGGDGTLKGALAISEEIAKRNLKIAVVGIPKTIDNDISYMDRSFGFTTAVSEARTSIYAASTEALGARNGIGLVKLMGRESGFIAAYATLATSEVNFCLVPEVHFTLEGFMETLRERILKRRHAVIVVAEGAGQELMAETSGTDASGNVRFGDIGTFLRDRIKEYFGKAGMELNLKYIDPSYTIRSKSATTQDSVFCLLLGHNAVHAAMSGRTGMVVGFWNEEFTHVPIRLAVSKRKRIDPNGKLWDYVLAATGQPRNMA